jgi:uncharacterized protein with gpF-like domain
MFNQRITRKAVEDFDTIYKRFMQEIGTQRIIDISETTRAIIAKIILDNREETPLVIARLIEERLSPKLTRARASTISRTETHTASSFAIQIQAEQFNEPQMIKRWISNSDERTRPSHLFANGQEVNIDDDFIVGGKKMRYTGDPKGGASEVVNCRCVIVYTEEEDDIIE